jgi:hypothetical protein
MSEAWSSQDDGDLGDLDAWMARRNAQVKDSPLNVSKPRGMSQGDFYEYHFGVDPQYYGGKLRSDLNGGRGWSGNRLGLERYSIPERIWAKVPQVWKDHDTGVALGEALGQLPLDDPRAPQ